MRFSLFDSNAGTQASLDTPAGEYGTAVWSPDGRRFAVMHTAPSGPTDLVVVEAASKTAQVVPGVRLNATRTGGGAYGEKLPCRWYQDSRSLLCLLVPEQRVGPPDDSSLAPQIRDTATRSGSGAPLTDRRSSYLRSANDAALYEHYMTAQPAKVSVVTGRVSLLGAPGIYQTLSPSPDERYILSVRITRPYSYETDDSRFPQTVEVLDAQGRLVRTIARVPQDSSGFWETGWRPPGPRTFFWRPDTAATLAYYEALDGGDPAKTAILRDSLRVLPAPFDAAPTVIFRSRGRMGFYPVRSVWGANGVLVLEEVEWASNKRRAWKVFADAPEHMPELLWEYVADERDTKPGQLATVLGPRAGRDWHSEALENDTMLLQDGNWVYLRGVASSPDGDRAFLDRYNLASKKKERLFRSEGAAYEEIIAILDGKAQRILTTLETAAIPPNYRILSRDTRSSIDLTQFVDLIPQITQARRERLEYLRRDGLKLTGEVYLPSGYVAGQRLPTIIWGYPNPTTNATGAQQLRNSAHRFVVASGDNHVRTILPMLTQGYAIFHAAMPVVAGRTTNDTLSEQLAANAEAAVAAVVNAGIADRARIAIAGYSFGGFMAASILENTHLFAAGIALSGIYAPELTAPFGFQEDPRSFWQVPDVYDRVSPWRNADRIKAPLLLVHGEQDENLTDVQAAHHLFRALYGLGATARLVTLPHERHGIIARESVLHSQWEILTWLDRHLRLKPAVSSAQVDTTSNVTTEM